MNVLERYFVFWLTRQFLRNKYVKGCYRESKNTIENLQTLRAKYFLHFSFQMNSFQYRSAILSTTKNYLFSNYGFAIAFSFFLCEKNVCLLKPQIFTQLDNLMCLPAYTACPNLLDLQNIIMNLLKICIFVVWLILYSTALYYI